MGRLNSHYDLKIKWGIDGKNIKSQRIQVEEKLKKDIAIWVGQMLDLKSEPTYIKFTEEYMRIITPYFPEMTTEQLKKSAHIWFHRIVANNCIKECFCIKE